MHKAIGIVQTGTVFGEQGRITASARTVPAKPAVSSPSAGPYQMRMSVEAWCAMLDNPRQRDTERRVHKATRTGGHLRVSSPVHAQTFAAQLPDGRMIKLDGHTRAWCWEHGRLAPPEQVLVTVIPAADMDEVKSLYNQFDDPRASENLQDKLSGALREHDLVLRSGCFSQLYASSLRAAHNLLFLGKQQPDLYAMVGQWKPLLQVIDTHGYGRMLAAAQAAMMLGYVRYPGTAQATGMMDFWESFFSGAKSGVAGRWLPAEALRYTLNLEKAQGAGGQATDRWMNYTLAAMNRHIDGKWYRGKSEPHGLLGTGGRTALVEWTQPARERVSGMSFAEIAELVSTKKEGV